MEDRIVIDIEFNYPHLKPRSSDWVGVYPCEDRDRNPSYSREPPIWAFTCYNRNCRLEPDDLATGVGNFTFDDNTQPGYTSGAIYSTIKKVVDESPGCYIVVLNRIDGDNEPPYYKICEGNEIQLVPISAQPSTSLVPSQEPSVSTRRSFFTVIAPASPEPSVKHIDPIQTCQMISFYSSAGILSENELLDFEDEAFEFLRKQWPNDEEGGNPSSVSVVNQIVRPTNRFLRALQGSLQLIDMKIIIQGFATPEEGTHDFARVIDRLFIMDKLVLQDALEARNIFISFDSTTKVNLQECKEN